MTRVDETTPSATVPTGLTPGQYTLSITDPRGDVVSARSPDFEFAGRLDELRIAAVVRSAAWVAAQHATARDSFISYGVPQQRM